jgi:hypothetical protein
VGLPICLPYYSCCAGCVLGGRGGYSARLMLCYVRLLVKPGGHLLPLAPPVDGHSDSSVRHPWFVADIPGWNNAGTTALDSFVEDRLFLKAVIREIEIKNGVEPVTSQLLTSCWTFLPFYCQSCDKTFCLDHRSETSNKWCAYAGSWAKPSIGQGRPLRESRVPHRPTRPSSARA